MPFITVGGLSQHIGESSAEVLIAAGQGKESTAFEAAQCVRRYEVAGDDRMHEAKEEYKRVYGRGVHLVALRGPGRSL